MSDVTSLQMLMHYNAWANMHLFKLLAALDPAEVARARKTRFGSISRILSHAYSFDLKWKGHLQRAPQGVTSQIESEEMSLPDLQSHQSEIDDWYIDYVECTENKKYDEEVSFIFLGKSPGRMTCGDMLHHVVNHRTYQRACIEVILYQMDLQPTCMDLAVFLHRSAAQ